MAIIRRWGMLGVSLLACVAVAYGARTLADLAWNGVVDYQSPYVGLDLPASEHGSAEATRTVFVIVDGLREDASREMGTLNRLRTYGADLELTAPQPSLSYPNWTTLLTGAPPSVSGVTTNWHDTKVEAESIFDTAARAGLRTAFVGPDDFEGLYGVRQKTDAAYTRPWSKRYRSAEYVNAAIRLADGKQLVVVHLPDVDEAGHEFGGASVEYRRAVSRVDADLSRLVSALGDGSTVFVVTADHGHLDTGGHGGWETEVTQVPCVIAGPGITIGRDTGAQESVAASVALLSGAAVPRMTTRRPLPSVVASTSAPASRYAQGAYDTFGRAYVDAVLAPMGGAQDLSGVGEDVPTGEAVENARRLRLDWDRSGRLPYGVVGLVAALFVLIAVGVLSWRALAAAATGALAYYVTFLGLYFGVHGYRFSLSAFNSEDLVGAWMNGRLVEAAIATLVAAAVAAAVYPFLRAAPKGPSGSYLAGWLTLGPVTALVVLATLGLQVAWFMWAWGVDPTWTLPDLHWGFKFDVDLLQATAVGLTALATPLVTYLVGRYHPKVRASTTEE